MTPVLLWSPPPPPPMSVVFQFESRTYWFHVQILQCCHLQGGYFIRHHCNTLSWFTCLKEDFMLAWRFSLLLSDMTRIIKTSNKFWSHVFSEHSGFPEEFISKAARWVLTFWFHPRHVTLVILERRVSITTGWWFGGETVVTLWITSIIPQHLIITIIQV